MPTPAAYSEASLKPSLGMFALPYANVPDGAGQDLSDKLLELYRAKVAAIPWLPDMWLDGVTSLHGANGYVLMPAPASKGMPIPWADSADKRAVWDALAAKVAAVVAGWGADLAAKGQAELRLAYSNSEFWNNAYRVAYVLATPVRVVGRVADAVDVVTGSPARILGLAAVIGAIVLYLKTRR